MKNKTMREQLRGEFYRNNKAVMCIAAVGSILSGTLGVIASWIVKLFIDTASGADGAVPLGRLIWFSSGFIIFALAANILDVFSQAKFVKRALVQSAN